MPLFLVACSSVSFKQTDNAAETAENERVIVAEFQFIGPDVEGQVEGNMYRKTMLRASYEEPKSYKGSLNSYPGGTVKETSGQMINGGFVHIIAEKNRPFYFIGVQSYAYDFKIFSGTAHWKLWPIPYRVNASNEKCVYVGRFILKLSETGKYNIAIENQFNNSKYIVKENLKGCEIKTQMASRVYEGDHDLRSRVTTDEELKGKCTEMLKRGELAQGITIEQCVTALR